MKSRQSVDTYSQDVLKCSIALLAVQQGLFDCVTIGLEQLAAFALPPCKQTHRSPGSNQCHTYVANLSDSLTISISDYNHWSLELETTCH